MVGPSKYTSTEAHNLAGEAADAIGLLVLRCKGELNQREAATLRDAQAVLARIRKRSGEKFDDLLCASFRRARNVAQP